MEKIATSDPPILGATPCFTGTRVPVSILFEPLAGGATLEEILAEIPTLQRATAVTALRHAQELLSQDVARRADEYDSMKYLLHRARETAQSGRSPVITETSPGAVYSRAIRAARKLGFHV